MEELPEWLFPSRVAVQAPLHIQFDEEIGTSKSGSSRISVWQLTRQINPNKIKNPLLLVNIAERCSEQKKSKYHANLG